MMTLFLILIIITVGLWGCMEIFYSKKGEYAIEVCKVKYLNGTMRMKVMDSFNFRYLAPFFLYKVRETIKDCQYIGYTSLDIIIGNEKLYFSLSDKSEDDIIEYLKKWLALRLKTTTICEI